MGITVKEGTFAKTCYPEYICYLNMLFSRLPEMYTFKDRRSILYFINHMSI